jgi:hypothetical protein
MHLKYRCKLKLLFFSFYKSLCISKHFSRVESKFKQFSRSRDWEGHAPCAIVPFKRKLAHQNSYSMRRSVHSLLKDSNLYFKKNFTSSPLHTRIVLYHLVTLFFLPGLTYLDGRGLGIDSDCFLCWHFLWTFINSSTRAWGNSNIWGWTKVNRTLKRISLKFRAYHMILYI